MECEDKLKEIHSKTRACYYFDDLINDIGINFSDTLLEEKLYKNILVYGIHKKLRLGEIDGFIRVRGSEFRYLGLCNHGLLDKICDKIKYLISDKNDGIRDSINRNFGSELIHIIIYLLKKY